MACGGGNNTPATNAPRIPPTETPSPIPSATLRRQPVTPNPDLPTANVDQPSWTPPPANTPQPTRTPPPSITPPPSATPVVELSTGIETLPDGRVRLVLGEETLNNALKNGESEFTPQLDFEPDGIWIELVIPNVFLNEETTVRASVEMSLSEGIPSFALQDFESSGPTVTRTQVRDAINASTDAINATIATQISEDVSVTAWSEYTLTADFLFLETR